MIIRMISAVPVMIRWERAAADIFEIGYSSLKPNPQFCATSFSVNIQGVILFSLQQQPQSPLEPC